MNAEFRFSDDEWRTYQAIPDQGYSHRHHLEAVFNRWLAARDERLDGQESEEAYWREHELDIPAIQERAKREHDADVLADDVNALLAKLSLTRDRLRRTDEALAHMVDHHGYRHPECKPGRAPEPFEQPEPMTPEQVASEAMRALNLAAVQEHIRKGFPGGPIHNPEAFK